MRDKAEVIGGLLILMFVAGLLGLLEQVVMSEIREVRLNSAALVAFTGLMTTAGSLLIALLGVMARGSKDEEEK